MHLRPVQQRDLPTYARVATLAMWYDPGFVYVAPKKEQYPESFYQLELRNARRRWYNGHFLFLCVSDQDDADWTGEEVAMGCCAYETTVPGVQKPTPGGWLGHGFERWMESLQRQQAYWLGIDRCIDWVAYRHFVEVIVNEVAFKEYYSSFSAEHDFKAKPGEDGLPAHWEIGLLATHPDFRRRGVGKVMLQEGFARATENQVPLILIATTLGKQLYLSMGFREVGLVKMVPEGLGTSKGNSRTRKRLEETDLGDGVGKGLVCSTMAWEPMTMRQR